MTRTPSASGFTSMRIPWNLPAAWIAAAVCCTFSCENGSPSFCTNCGENLSALTSVRPATWILETFWPSYGESIPLGEPGKLGTEVAAGCEFSAGVDCMDGAVLFFCAGAAGEVCAGSDEGV